MNFGLVAERFGLFPSREMAEESYEEMSERITDANEEHLAHFTNDLILGKKMGKMKAHEHAERLRFFGNEFLLNYRSEDLVGGLGCFGGFVGDWLIRKCMWSDAEAVRKNAESFSLWLRYVRESVNLPPDDRAELSEWQEEIDENLELWCLRSDCYNDPSWEPEDLFDEYGSWNDEALKKGGARSPNLITGTGRLVLNLLLSAQACKFVGIKPPELVKLSDWGDWESPKHRWFSNWRCEVCFGMEGTKEKVLMVMNLATRYSVLIRIAGNDPKVFLIAVHAAIMRVFDEHQVARPGTVDLEVKTLSGAARSVTSTQNNQIYRLDDIMDRPQVKYLEDAEGPLNHIPIKVTDYLFPDRLFADKCREEPPFAEIAGPDNVVSFLN